MAIPLKNDEQIQKMRESGKIVAETLQLLEENIRTGITTEQLDKIAEKYILQRGAIPSFKGQGNPLEGDVFSASICASVNEQVIHGIPSGRKLLSGDIISIDVGAYKNGFHGDAARTFAVGEVSEEALQLIEVTKQSFFEGIKFAKQGCNLHQISAAIEEYVSKFGYSVVRDYVGHGIGKQLHEAPQIPHYKMPSRGPKLCKGMVLAIEPMINMGTYKVDTLQDNWTIVTQDRKLSAHYENTLVITEGEPELLTMY